MRLSDILSRKGGEVVCVAPDGTLLDAIAELNRHKIGAVLVRSQTGIEGILTERDVLRACHERLHELPDLRVCDVMTRELVIGKSDDTLAYAMGVMTQRRIRHLPVFEGGALVGMVSIGDLVSAQLNDASFEIRMMHEYIAGYIPWAQTG
jgi:CBS domain-containing protein